MTKIINKFLPLFDARPKSKIDTLVIHCCAHSADDMLKVMQERRVSSHYVIENNGKIYRPIAEKNRAWHAGISYWRGRDNINNYSIGIELESCAMGELPYSSKQINSLVVLARQIIKHYQIPAYNVVAHSDISPTRKPDPGIEFPWKYLAQKNIGWWYDINDACKVQDDNIERLLRIIGYDTTNLAAASYAFCRRFIPSRVAILRDADKIISEVFPPDFVLTSSDLLILKACAYKYGRINSHRD